MEWSGVRSKGQSVTPEKSHKERRNKQNGKEGGNNTNKWQQTHPRKGINMEQNGWNGWNGMGWHRIARIIIAGSRQRTFSGGCCACLRKSDFNATPGGHNAYDFGRGREWGSVEWTARMRRDEGAPGSLFSWVLFYAEACQTQTNCRWYCCCLARYQLLLQRMSQ